MFNSLADIYVDKLRKSGYAGTIRTYAPISDTHGNHAELHKAEIEAIASEVVDQKLDALLPEIASSAFSTAYQQFCKDLSFDVTETINIALDDATNIFSDQKTRKIVAENLTRSILKQLGTKHYNITR